jgi:hypothetical protein
MTIYLCNKEPIDLNTITLMGVSVKTGKNPIGYFGTGLKYAIATLLRTGHSVALHRDGQLFSFGTVNTKVRDEEFDVVTMLDEGHSLQQLGFTTALGRNWEVWQAYRELRSNCIDEGGIVIGDRVPSVQDYGTIFSINGDAFEVCHINRREIFLESQPLTRNASCEIHSGATNKAFYRGVRAAQMQHNAMFTYNITATTELTEDRTIKHSYMIEHYAKTAVINCDNEELIEKIVMAPKGTFEQQFSYESMSDVPSHAFMEVVQRNHRSVYCNMSAIKLWQQHSYLPLNYEPVPLDDYEMEQLEKALVLVHRLGAKISLGEFWVVEGLGESVFGCVRENRILIAKCCFDLGHRFIASTLYEEWLHKFEGLKDENRAMQNRLFEQLLAMTERLIALEGKR